MATVAGADQSEHRPDTGDLSDVLDVVEERWHQVPQTACEWPEWDWVDQEVFLHDMCIVMARIPWLLRAEQEGWLTLEQLTRWHALLRFIHAQDATLMELFEGTAPKAWVLPPLPAEVR